MSRYHLDLRPAVLDPPEAFSDALAPLNPDLWYWPRVDPGRMREKSRAVALRIQARELTLTEPASSLWRAIRGPLAALRQRYEEKPERWQMGGGSVLAARWKHRRSTDIDLITSAGWHLAGLRKTGP